MNDNEPNLEDASSPPKKMNVLPPIYRLPVELLTKIIEKLPRTQWPALELIDPDPAGGFRKATSLAWGSLREVDIDRDFLYSETKEIVKFDESDSEMAEDRLCRQTARKTELILQKLLECSPLISELSGVSLMAEDSSLNTTAIQYLSQFEYLESIRFTKNRFVTRIGTGPKSYLDGGIHIVNLIEFIESTRSRATLKEINIEGCYIPDNPEAVGHFDRLGTALANNSNDPVRQSLKLELFSMGFVRHEGAAGFERPVTFFESIDTSRMMSLSLGNLEIEPAALTTLINGAPQLQHIDFAFLQLCSYWSQTRCRSVRLQANKELLAALGSHSNLRSLEFTSISICEFVAIS